MAGVEQVLVTGNRSDHPIGMTGRPYICSKAARATEAVQATRTAVLCSKYAVHVPRMREQDGRVESDTLGSVPAASCSRFKNENGSVETRYPHPVRVTGEERESNAE
jgi:hypothetical protein